jgi:hypothetical protein
VVFKFGGNSRPNVLEYLVIESNPIALGLITKLDSISPPAIEIKNRIDNTL